MCDEDLFGTPFTGGIYVSMTTMQNIIAKDHQNATKIVVPT